MELSDYKRKFFENLQLGSIYYPPEDLAHDSEIKTWFQDLNSLKNIFNDSDMNQIEEVIIESPESAFIYFSDHIQKIDLNIIEENYWNDFCYYLCLKHDLAFNTQEPFQSFKIKFSNISFRITIIHEHATDSKFHKIFLRKHSCKKLELNNFYKESHSDELEKLIGEIIENKDNFIISGATGSGKTSFLRSMLERVNPIEHIITIEDTQELDLKHPHKTSFVAKEHINYSLKKYCEYSLRSRPDRIILGEIRSAEVIPYILSMNTGHRGSAATVHANNAIDALFRLGTLFELNHKGELNYNVILKMIAKSVKWVIHLDDKKISEIIRVINFENGTIQHETLFRQNESNFSHCAFMLHSHHDAI